MLPSGREGNPGSACVCTSNGERLRRDEVRRDDRGHGGLLVFNFETDKKRWRRLERTMANPHQKTNKKITRRAAKKDIQSIIDSKVNEMCANCHVLEKYTAERKLFVCEFRECQKQHWKKVHKKQCVGGKKSWEPTYVHRAKQNSSLVSYSISIWWSTATETGRFCRLLTVGRAENLPIDQMPNSTR
jgi:hypothetical protein